MIDDPETAELVSQTGRRQQRASTPTLSAWVSANAGSGKTHVLANRVIRLLLRGTAPSAILCLTYTKAAAAEMSNRVFRLLADWSRLGDGELSEHIRRIEGTFPDAASLDRARRLFATALETPGGLKIQTIHAFCEAVLQRFPLEANVPGHFHVLDDNKAAELLAEARRTLFSTASMEDDPRLAAAMTSVLDIGGESGLDKLLTGLYERRREIAAFLGRGENQAGNLAGDKIGSAGENWSAIRDGLRDALAIPGDETRDDVKSRFWPMPDLPLALVRQMHETAVREKLSTAKAFAEKLLDADRQHDPSERLERIRSAFLTKGGEPASLRYVAAAAISKAIPDIGLRLEAAQQTVLTHLDALRAHDALEAADAALIIACRYLGEFEQLKRRQAGLDYDDLIAGTESLLSRAGAGAWVHYKLDQGIDHILVDEAQDTAPSQWNVIRSLSEEFFSGAGARSGLRTLFAVGDEKQSIYSFQGARPERFAEERAIAEKRALDAGLEFERVPLTVSFRSSREVLALVDLVFANEDARRGLGEDSASVIHETARRRAPGLVELWETIGSEEAQSSESWVEPFDHTPEAAPVARLAHRIAGVLGEWIGREKIMDSKTGKLRPIRAGDVMVLVRKRDAFVPTLLRTLKATSDIPVAGADRLRLTDHVAIQDLLALGRYALLADDDLSLAALVKSPLIGLSEDHLFRLAALRVENTSLSRQLEHLARTDAEFAAMAETLSRWSILARSSQVHEFYAGVLGPGGGRERFLARLGREVGDVLDEFLGLTLDHEEAGLPGLQAFIAMLESQSPEIKRELEQESDAVRVMTIHASKGLEAPVVFLVDSGGEAFPANHVPHIWLLPSGPRDRPPAPVWVPGKSFRTRAGEPAYQAICRQAEEEYRRQLYVGLTRPADRLVICGYRGKKEPRSPTWHSMVCDAFDMAARQPENIIIGEASHCQGTEEAFTALELRMSGPQVSAAADEEPAGEPASAIAFDCPAGPLPHSPVLPRPLIPSGAAAVIDAGAASHEEALISPFGAAGDPAAPSLDRGRAVHRLLQVLPGMPEEERTAAARRYLDRALAAVTADERTDIASRVTSILADPRFAQVFEGQASAEVSLMGTLEIGGEQRIVSGRIDRLVIAGERVLIVDYKTGLPPPAGSLPQSHVAQLAIYRALLAPLYPGREITAALLYTSGPLLAPLDPGDLEQIRVTPGHIRPPRNSVCTLRA